MGLAGQQYKARRTPAMDSMQTMSLTLGPKTWIPTMHNILQFWNGRDLRKHQKYITQICRKVDAQIIYITLI